MKAFLPILFASSLAVAAVAADATPKEEVLAAVKKLDAQPNYGWKSTITVAESSQFKPGPTEGKTEKDGFTYATLSFGQNLAEITVKGDKVAFTGQNGAWISTSEAEGSQGPDQFLARIAKNLKTPTAQTPELLGSIKELKKEGDLYSGEFTDEGAKKQFRFGEPKNPKGSVKFWLKDGLLHRIETKVDGKMEFNGNEFDASRTTLTEIKDVGSTKLNVPADAKKKLL